MRLMHWRRAATGRVREGRGKELSDADLPTTPDGVEIALEANAKGEIPTGIARIVLEKQAAFLDTQIEELHRHRVRDYLFTSLAATALALVGFFVWSAANSRGIVVEAFDTPPALAERGLTPQVMAGTVQDAIAGLQAANLDAARNSNIENAWTGDIKVQVPNVGISIGDIDRTLRAKLGHETHISGSVVRNVDETVTLAIRATGVPPKTFTGPETTLPALTEQAAEYVYGAYEPELFAGYLVRLRPPAEGIAFVEAALPRIEDDKVRAYLIGRWALALQRQGDLAGAERKNREALEVDPYSWRSWNNLTMIATYKDNNGSEAAIRIGHEQLRRLAEAPANRRPQGLEMDLLGNYQSLVNDYTGWIQASKAAMQAAGGRNYNTVGDALLNLASSEASRHDPTEARRLYDRAPPSATKTATMLFSEITLEQDAGNVAAAARSADALHPMFLANEDVRQVFPDGECDIAQAYAMAGRRAEADALFAKAKPDYECLTAQADAIAAHDGFAATDAAYARAVKNAPSAPGAYQEWGAALAKRGDFARAEAMFRKANEMGPNWADPLKSLGDMAARRGALRDARDLYARATPLAPHWAALSSARADVDARIAALPWWKRWFL
jgi:Tfp pilus assembly protein PilF